MRRQDFSGSPESVWQQGENITCSVDPTSLAVTVIPPVDFDPTKPVKLFTHGFIDTVTNDNTQFVQAWEDYHGGRVGVVLLDWANLAWFAQISDWDDFVYDLAARNSIDVGEFTGLCMAALAANTGLQAGQMHLVGHSLGAHLVGKAGRMLKSAGGRTAGRVTGLDPAGPRFVDGPVLPAIPELAAELLDTQSAAFVDIIHTNGGWEPAAVSAMPRLGALQQLGHRDFYPDGGSVQGGCILGQDALPGGACSHCRAVLYFLHSLREPDLFPSQACSTVDDCNWEWVSDPAIIAYMGERGEEGFAGGRELLYQDIQDCHWNFVEHNNWFCTP